MLRKLLSLNLKELQIAFFAGTAVGAFCGIGVGLGMGVGLGTLFAPKKGSDLRADLREKLHETTDNLKEQGLLMVGKATELYDQMAQPSMKESA